MHLHQGYPSEWRHSASRAWNTHWFRSFPSKWMGRSPAISDEGGSSACETHSRHTRRSFPDLLCFRRRSEFALCDKQWISVNQNKGMFYLLLWFNGMPWTDISKDDEGLVIVDAGGGTIDISAYARQSQSYFEIAAPQCRFHKCFTE